MGDMTVRNIPEDDHRALKRIARSNSRSTEAEARLAIAHYIEAQRKTGFGSRLHEAYGGAVDDDFVIERDAGSSNEAVFG